MAKAKDAVLLLVNKEADKTYGYPRIPIPKRIVLQLRKFCMSLYIHSDSIMSIYVLIGMNTSRLKQKI